jgi:N-acetylglucosamine kinase-like BadF-type ATPase
MTEKEEDFYLGIEATGRTIALLADGEGNILGRGTAGPSVYSTVGQERCSQALWTAIVTAFSGAGYNTRDLLASDSTLPFVKATCVAMSGVERPKDEAAIRRIVGEFNLGGKTIATSEAHGVLMSGAPDNFGVAVIAGDSGLAYGLAPDGRSARAGGWNYLLGDEGSAHYIGLRAVRRVLQAADGRGPETELTALINQEWKIPANRPDILADQIYKLSTAPGSGGNKAQIEDAVEGYKRGLGLLAPLVERTAAKGDRVAQQILDEAADNLAQAVRAVINRTGMFDQVQALSRRGGTTGNLGRSSVGYELAGSAGKRVVESAAIPLVVYGSVITSNAGELRQRLSQRLTQCSDPILVDEPAQGALKIALQAV